MKALKTNNNIQTTETKINTLKNELENMDFAGDYDNQCQYLLDSLFSILKSAEHTPPTLSLIPGEKS